MKDNKRKNQTPILVQICRDNSYVRILSVFRGVFRAAGLMNLKAAIDEQCGHIGEYVGL